MEVHYSSIHEGLQLSSGPLEKAVLYMQWIEYKIINNAKVPTILRLVLNLQEEEEEQEEEK